MLTSFVFSEMIFLIPKVIAFLSQGTTLEQGTIIMTGTPPGIGCMRKPKVVLNDGDDIRIEIENIGKLNNYRGQQHINILHAGTLINTVYYEKI